MEEQSDDRRVARNLQAYFIHNNEMNRIQIEYRYVYKVGFDLLTTIQGKTFQFSELKFFSVLSNLLDQLPQNSMLMIPHQVAIVNLDEHTESTVTLEEWLYPYEEKDNGTVVYQLKLSFNGVSVETALSTAFSVVVRDMQRRLGDKFQIKVCWFCKYLVEEIYYGGTDSRHDQLYCFRDRPDLLTTVLNTSPRLYARDPLLAKATPDMSALHSCSAFIYSPNENA